jgi:hypothetical protein
MTPLKIKKYLVYYMHQRVIIFPVHEYQEILVNQIIKNFIEWELLDNKLITCKEKYFKYFLEKEIDSILDTFRFIFSDLNVKILTVYNNRELSEDSRHWFEEPSKFNKSLIKILKQKTKYFKNVNKDNLLFINAEGEYKGIKIGNPSGAEIEFLQKTLA